MRDVLDADRSTCETQHRIAAVHLHTDVFVTFARLQRPGVVVIEGTERGFERGEIDEVVTLFEVRDDIVARRKSALDHRREHEGVATVAAGQDVVAGPAIEYVPAGATIESIVAIAAQQNVVAAIAEQEIVTTFAVQGLSTIARRQ